MEFIMKQYLFLPLSLFLFLSACQQEEPAERPNKRQNQYDKSSDEPLSEKDDEDKTDQEDEKNTDNPSDSSEDTKSQNASSKETPIITLLEKEKIDIDVSIQFNAEEKKDYIFWECSKGDQVIGYLLNKNPSIVDEPGTDRARQRICELYQVVNSRTILLSYAHFEKDFCSKKLDEHLTLKQSDDKNKGGFSCEQKEVEVLDNSNTKSFIDLQNTL